MKISLGLSSHGSPGFPATGIPYSFSSLVVKYSGCCKDVEGLMLMTILPQLTFMSKWLFGFTFPRTSCDDLINYIIETPCINQWHFNQSMTLKYIQPSTIFRFDPWIKDFVAQCMDLFQIKKIMLHILTG